MTTLSERQRSAEAQAFQIAQAVGACASRGAHGPTWIVTFESLYTRRVLVSADHGVVLLSPLMSGRTSGISRAASQWCLTTDAIKWMRAEHTWYRQAYRRLRWGSCA
jgi:hypothetical protein